MASSEINRGDAVADGINHLFILPDQARFKIARLERASARELRKASPRGEADAFRDNR